MYRYIIYKSDIWGGGLIASKYGVNFSYEHICIKTFLNQYFKIYNNIDKKMKKKITIPMKRKSLQVSSLPRYILALFTINNDN